MTVRFAVLSACLVTSLAWAIPPPPASRWVAVDDAAYDSQTKLTWQRAAPMDKFTWENAKLHCAGLGDGWRLPTRDELAGIDVDPALHPADPVVFAQEARTSENAWFWSGDVSDHFAWAVSRNGTMSASYDVGATRYAFRARCVRPGAPPANSFDDSVKIKDFTATFAHKKNGAASAAIVHLTLPVIFAMKNPAVAHKLNEKLGVKNLTGDADLAALKAEIADSTDGLVAADYKINHNAHGLLDITLRSQSMGAYPSADAHHLLLDLHTGEEVDCRTLFRAEKIPALVALINGKMRAAIEKSDAWKDADMRAMVADQRFDQTDLQSVGYTGDFVVFSYDFGLPHAILAASPDSVYAFKASELQDYLNPGGAFGFLTAKARQ